jgi:translocation and assembly module TamB
MNITADIGQLLAQAAQPAAAPDAGGTYLSGMQLDVRIVNGPGFQLETTLSSDVEADVDLRLRGTPSRPALLGSIAVNRGDVQVFGNRYQVERGDIRFLNPVRVEPSFDMDLSTRARGVTVNISFSGTLQRMNVNYSSDPPLQSAEIIALLAVGRDPTATTSQVAPGIVNNSATSFAAAGGSLLGQAASAQVSNRLQRFFGASRVKIDPTLTGVDNIPQARLTLEQQVSKDITLTYITNLNRTQEQIVRVQWDLSREWSAIAVRDPNGLFGIDFQFRKRFK